LGRFDQKRRRKGSSMERIVGCGDRSVHKGTGMPTPPPDVMRSQRALKNVWRIDLSQSHSGLELKGPMGNRHLSLQKVEVRGGAWAIWGDRDGDQQKGKVFTAGRNQTM